MTDHERELHRLTSLLMQSIAERVKVMLSTIYPDGVGFVVVVFGPGRLQYVSNAKRDAVAEAMSNLVDRWAANGPRGDVPYIGVGEFMNDDMEMIATPIGKIRWGDVRRAMDDLKTAEHRIADMLENDDGQAHKEARKFLDRRKTT